MTRGESFDSLAFLGILHSLLAFGRKPDEDHLFEHNPEPQSNYLDAGRRKQEN